MHDHDGARSRLAGRRRCRGRRRCAADGSHAAAPDDTPACGSGAACDADADCAVFPGNYCLPGVCAYLGCLRGRCTLTKVQGQPCTRDGECVSGLCACAPTSCVCAPQSGAGGSNFP